jgi:hemophore-related protein
MTSFSTKLAVALGGVAVSLAAATGIASADPGTDALVNSTCTYDQAVAAINAVNPGYAKEFNANPGAQALLKQFIGMSPEQRRGQLAAAQGTPLWAQYGAPIEQAAGVCANY